MFSSAQSQQGQNNWQQQLDKFVKANQQELAALAWGLWLENKDSQGTIGIDLKPNARFVYCPREAIEELNRQTENNVQEILGFVDAHQPEKEVLMIGIGKGQINLIQFEPELAPPDCFEKIGDNVDTLIERLEERLTQLATINDR